MKRRMQLLAVILFSIAICVSVFTAHLFSQTPLNIKVNPQTGNLEEIALEEWVKDHSVLGITNFRGSEFYMRARTSGYYYVLVAPDDYSSRAATTSVTLRNVNDASSVLGYGLIFHSDPTPLKQDYAFLIDTTKKGFRVVRHSANKEYTISRWTNSPFINAGRQENTLQVRDMAETSELYINGHLVATVENTFAVKDGAPGLYTDIAKIAFKDFTIDHTARLPQFK